MIHCSASQRSKKLFCLFSLFFLLLALPLASSGKEKQKDFPLTGKITGKGQNQHTSSSGGNNNIPVHTQVHFSHTYKIETDTRVYEVDCGKTAMFHTEGPECGGEQPLDIGTVLHFRVEKNSILISLPNGKEQKLRILEESAKPDPAPAKPEATK